MEITLGLELSVGYQKGVAQVVLKDEELQGTNEEKNEKIKWADTFLLSQATALLKAGLETAKGLEPEKTTQSSGYQKSYSGYSQKKTYSSNGIGKATDKQLAFARKLGYKGSDEVSSKEISSFIENAKNNKDVQVNSGEAIQKTQETATKQENSFSGFNGF